MRRLTVLLVCSLFLAMIATGSLFAGGGKEQEQSGMTGGAEQQEEVTLTFSDWHLAESHWEEALTEAMEIFEEENPGINVELQTVSYGEKETRYSTQIEAGRGPDIYHLHGYSMRNFIAQGYTQNLSQFIDEEGSGFLDPWYDKVLPLLQENGDMHGMPGDFQSMVLLYNTELFEEAGLDPNQPPETWQEFLSYAQQLTRDRNGDGNIDTWGFGTIGAISPGFELRATPVFYSHGARYLNDDNSCSALHTDNARQAFDYFTSLVSEHGVVPPGVTSQNPGTVRQQMANEQVAMIIGSAWTVPIVATNNPDLGAREVLAAAPLPVAEGYDGNITTTAWLSGWFMNPNSENKQEAWELMKFITSQEMEQKWFDDTRVLSSRRDVSGQYEPLLNDKFAQVISSRLANAKFVPQIPQWPQIIESVNTAAQEAMTGGQSAEAALGEAHAQINQILGGSGCPSF